jgi:hypothetical protein
VSGVWTRGSGTPKYSKLAMAVRQHTAEVKRIIPIKEKSFRHVYADSFIDARLFRVVVEAHVPQPIEIIDIARLSRDQLADYITLVDKF